MGAAISYKYTNNYSFINYRIMTVVIDESNSNPATCCTYADDAVGMPHGLSSSSTSAWQEFFGYRPCLFKDGVVVGYLNPNDYSKFEDGSSADITSGDAGDVMIEFPRLGIRFNRPESKKLHVSVTNNPNLDGFTYAPYTRNSVIYDRLYISAYLAVVDPTTRNTLRSLSDKVYYAGSAYEGTRSIIPSWDTGNTYIQNNGNGYGLLNFYQYNLIRAMYLMQFCNLDSQSVLGNGNHKVGDIIGRPDSGAIKSGVMDHGGLVTNTSIQSGYSSDDWNDYNAHYNGDITDDRVKLFGIEDVYGFVATYLCGVFLDKDRKNNEIMLSDHDYINYPSTYTKHTTSSPIYMGYNGFITSVEGTNSLFFFPSGKSSGTYSNYENYYCDQFQTGDDAVEGVLQLHVPFTTVEHYPGLSSNAYCRGGIFGMAMASLNTFTMFRMTCLV